jgi:hypothetical protein
MVNSTKFPFRFFHFFVCRQSRASSCFLLFIFQSQLLRCQVPLVYTWALVAAPTDLACFLIVEFERFARKACKYPLVSGNMDYGALHGCVTRLFRHEDFFILATFCASRQHSAHLCHVMPQEPATNKKSVYITVI